MKYHLPIRRTVMSIVAVLACLSTVQANDSRINPDTVYTVDYEIPSYIIPAQTEANKRMLEKARNLRSGRNLLERLLSLNENTTAVLQGSSTDFAGCSDEEYKEYYDGIEVDGSRCVIHYNKDGDMTSITGNFRTIDNLDVTPTITEAAALQAALDDIGAEEYAWENTSSRDKALSVSYPKGDLVVYAKSDKIALAYKFGIASTIPNKDYYVYVDAHKGNIIKKISASCMSNATTTVTTVHSGQRTITTNYYSGDYRLRDFTRGNGIITLDCSTLNDYHSSDNTWNDLASYDRIALDAHWNAEATYDYYLNKLQRNSYDNSGSQVVSLVNNTDMGENAVWSPSLNAIKYGVGSNGPFVALDVTAHEFTHGVTGATSKLDYEGESGAINEGMSDVFSVCVENEAKPNSGDNIWVFGEDLKSGGYRNFRYPDCKMYYGYTWVTDSVDNYGVHTNSGVFSYWFYLLAEGGTGTNDAGTPYSVEGIGLDKAIEICYKMNTGYLQENSKYQDACRSSYLAAEQLGYSDYIDQIRNAWVAVGVDMPSNVNISGSSVLCSSEMYAVQNIPLPISYTLSWDVVGADSAYFSYSYSGYTCTVTPLALNLNKSAILRAHIMYSEF